MVTAFFAPHYNVPAVTTSYSMPLTRGASIQAAPISGVHRVLVVAAYFPDINYTVSTDTLRQEWFGSSGSVAAYYSEISYGTFKLTGDVVGWYALPYVESHYGMDCRAIDDADCSGQDQSFQIANDAVPQAEKAVNFNNYDYFVFVHSGDGEESSGVKNDVWSVTYMGGIDVQTATRTLYQFSIVAELQADGASPVGVFCHEFAHLLNIPDLFNTDTGKTILGPWTLMDAGTWNGAPPGSSPAHLIAWGKIQLGWIAGPMLAFANSGQTNTYTIDPTEVPSNNVHVVEVPVGTDQVVSQSGTESPAQYYLIEVRASIGFDSELPATGVLISYVDNTAVVGRIHLMDGHPSVAGLQDAVWITGQTFTDAKNGISITIDSKQSNSYQVTVNRGGSKPPPPPPIQNQNQTSYVDLAVTGVKAQPVVVTLPNTTVTITVQISNLGNQNVSNVPVEVDLDNSVYTNLQISVGAAASTETNFTWVSTLGNHVFRIVVDPDNIFNETNRVNNAATFDLSVGPTLTINVPLNVSAAENIWVSVNGVKYNMTTGQLQTAVSAGNITVEIQPDVNMSRGIRQVFTGWSDGSSANPRQIAITQDTTLHANYVTQYLLYIDSNGGLTTSSGWYLANTRVYASVTNPSTVQPNHVRLSFNGWTGNLTSTSPFLQVNMTKPVFVKANWTPQYYVTVVTPVGSPIGSGWYDIGQIVTVGVNSSIIQKDNGERFLLTGWNSSILGNNTTSRMTVNAPAVLQATWKTQYELNVQSTYGNPQGAGWYDAGTNVPVNTQSILNYSNSTRRVFTGWTGDYTGESSNVTIQMDSPKVMTANWATQYLVTFNIEGVQNSTTLELKVNGISYPISDSNNVRAWYSAGSTINPIINQTVTYYIFAYNFAGWYDSSGNKIQTPIIVNGPESYTAQYNLGGLQLDYKSNYWVSMFGFTVSRVAQSDSFYLQSQPLIISSRLNSVRN
ncbi:MAG TPA: M6 family metalloprotease domain-containing protein [Candidatus Bathyarchaeia archaeon]|nr:M6 family metalloprotease domain-containing protein [Candidatus Bathyarchaeia archaeon]